MYDNVRTVDRGHSDSIIAVNSVIRNTYLLLSMTLLFSAATAGLAMYVNAAPSIFVTILAFGALFATSALSTSVWGLPLIFLFTGLMGYSVGPLLNAYLNNFSNGSEIIMASLGSTGVIFLSLSGYALTTRKDFSYLGGFLFVALLTMIIASIALMFFQVPALHLAISCGIVLIMSGYILYDTSQIIHGGQRNYILATISLYLNIYNIFVSLLHIFAQFAGRRD